jgi:hypothetical protein
MAMDYEERQYNKLTGKRRHYCPDWDGMAIDEHSPEYAVCACHLHRDVQKLIGDKNVQKKTR